MATARSGLDASHVTGVLGDALPYIRRFSGCIVVVKYGGNAMTDARLKDCFARDIALMRLVGMRPVVVHGGGPQIGEMLTQVGKPSEFVQGMRITDDETMRVVEMVLGGAVNKDIVGLIRRHGGRAVGITGKDGGVLRARKMWLSAADGSAVDIGRVGEVDAIDTALIDLLVGSEFVPVLAPIGFDEEGGTYNINADVAAGALAGALRAEKLLFLTNTPGVLDADGELLAELDVERTEALIRAGVIGGGMLPKVRYALDAVRSGVGTATILDGRVEHALLLELFTAAGVGTQFASAPA